MYKFLSLPICFSLVLMLSGCSNYTDPKPWGRGYSSYDQEFKSAPGSKARAIGYEYSNERNAAVLDLIRPTVQDLVSKLDAKLSFSIDKIYLTPLKSTAFYSSFDYILRDELEQNGYEIVFSPENAVQVDFVARKADKRYTRCTDDNDNNVYLALAINVVNGVPQDFVSGFYKVPPYDYRYDGRVKIKVPTCE